MAGLNDMQDLACRHVDGPLLILAGAGSGKTRVITHRVAYLMDEIGVNPYNILAITFTNKAAAEMRDRVNNIVGEGAERVWVSTFHSLCVRILRRFSDRLGYATNFNIYDSDDQKSAVKNILKELKIDPKKYPEKMFMAEISNAKERYISPDQYAKMNATDFVKTQTATVYSEYMKRLRKFNAFDFDDLIYKVVELFEHNPDVLELYQDRFRYIMVDEYQDTNHIQFLMVKQLASKYRNLCVVGDDDQSIYKFRGANITNILNFEKEYPDAKVVKLEQNYRSCGNILAAANAVIKHNEGRKDKALWTDQGDGEKLVFNQSEDEYMEADRVVNEIIRLTANGVQYKDIALLYRTNAQSRMFEEKFVTANIPYKIIGGINFYARREIKDILAYLKTVDNGQDDLAVRRIINVPKRGIGLTSINRVQEYAAMHEKGFYECLKGADLIPDIGRGVSKLESFVALIEHFKVDAKELTLHELMQEIIDETGYIESIQAESEIEAQARIENIDELLNKVVAYEEVCEEHDEPVTLSGFLEEVALVADIDNLDENSDYVVLMTLHSAKGLEFPRVYLAGMEDGLFPSYMTVTADDPDELEEERRLCYVGITRAQSELTMTCARRRMVRGETQYNKMSRFLKEVPLELISTGNKFSGNGKSLTDHADHEEPERKTDYQMARQAFKTKAFAAVQQGKSFGKPAGGKLEYGVGDRVRHMKFGEGTVLSIVEGGRDYEVTVNFDGPGTKKMFAAFAKLQKI